MESALPVTDPAQQPPKLQKVYNYLRGKNMVRSETYEDFEKKMADPVKAEKVYNFLKESNKLRNSNTFEDFQVNMGLKKKEQSKQVLSEGLSTPSETSFNEGLDKEQSLKELSDQWKNIDQQRGPMVQEQSLALDNLKNFDASQIGQEKSPEQLRHEFQQQQAQQVGAQKLVEDVDRQQRPEMHKEQNPLVTAGKSIWNVLSNQLPSAIASTASMITPTEIKDYRNLVKRDEETLKKDAIKVKQSLLEYAQKQQGEGVELTADVVKRIDQVKDPIDALNYFFNATGQAVGQIPLAVATRGGSAVVQEVGSIYLESVKKIAKEKGLTVGQVIEQGLDEPAYALTYGVVAGLMERAGAGKVLQSFGKEALKKSIQDRAKAVAMSGMTEATTEYAQGWLEEVGAEHGSGKGFSESLSTVAKDPERRKQIAEGFIQGLIGGTALSGAGQLSSKITQKSKVNEQSKKSQPVKAGTVTSGESKSGPDKTNVAEPKISRADKQDVGQKNVEPAVQAEQSVPETVKTEEPVKLTEKEQQLAKNYKSFSPEDHAKMAAEYKEKIEKNPDHEKLKIWNDLLQLHTKLSADTRTESEGLPETSGENAQESTEKRIVDTARKILSGEVTEKNVDREFFDKNKEAIMKEMEVQKEQSKEPVSKYFKLPIDKNKYGDDKYLSAQVKEDVDIDKIAPSQETVDKDYVSNPDPDYIPSLTKVGDKYIVEDGHNRIVKKIKAGEKTISANVRYTSEEDFNKNAPKATEQKSPDVPAGSETTTEPTVERTEQEPKDLTNDQLNTELDAFDKIIREREDNIKNRSNTPLMGSNSGVGTLTQSELDRFEALKAEASNRDWVSPEEAKERVKKSRAERLARKYIPSTEGEISETKTEPIAESEDQTKGAMDNLPGKESGQEESSLKAAQPPVITPIEGDSNKGFKGLKVGDEVEYEWMDKRYKGKIEKFDKDKAKIRGEGPVPNALYPIKPQDIRVIQVKKAKPKDADRAVEYNRRLKKPIGIVGNPNTGFMFQTDLGQTFAKFFQKQFTTKGFLPRGVFDRWLTAKGEISKYEAQIKFTGQDFKKAIREDYGSKITDDQITDINLALQGKQPVNPIPPKTKQLIKEMRSQIDNLTNRFINEGVVAGQMSQTFTKNLGEYITRSYRKYDDPFWAEFVPDPVKNKAMAYLRAKYPGYNQQEIDGLINFLIHSPEAPMAVLKGSKLGSKDLSILKKRGDIAPEIRALMGEYGDPLLNYARSVTKMANMIAKHHFLEDVKKQGMGTFLFDKPTGKYHVPVAAEGSRTMAPLNGLYTSEEIAEAFNEFNAVEPMGDIARWYMKINGYLKLGKTVFSVMTHARNFFGNLGFVLANGHWRLNKAGKAAQIAWANVYSSDKAIRDKFQEYIELGIVQDSAAAGQLKHYLDDIKGGQDIFQRLNETRMNKMKNYIIKNSALEFTQNMYQFEDDLYKIYAFENEMARYKKAYPNMPVDQLKDKVAKIVRDTYPTYSMIPKIVKTVRANPIVGTFVSFPAEVLRTTWNTAALIKEELSNPSTRDIGVQRLAGFMLALTLPTTASYFSYFALGLDGEDDEALRKFVAPWQKNSEFIYLNVDGTKYKIIDMGYSDPHSYLKRPVYSLLKDDDLLRGGINASKDIVEPFLSEEMLTERLIDITRNQKKTGGDHVYNPDAPLGDRLNDIYNHLAAVGEPGTVRSIENVYKGFYGKTDKYGRKYDAVNEVAALLTGQKVELKDIDQALLFRVYEIKDRLEATDTDYQRVEKSKSATPEEKQAAEKERAGAVKRIVTDAISIYHAAVRLGVDPKQARRLMRNARSKEINKKLRAE